MKVGIISLFYKNYNYGGQLQAYALCRVLNDLLKDKGKAEQICYDNKIKGFKRIPSEPFLKKLLNSTFNEKREIIISLVKQKLIKQKTNHTIDAEIEQRKAAFDKFSERHISFSKEVYNYKTIKNANGEYDGFVVGSDQVWNPLFYNPSYFLEFAENCNYKASYAASVSQRVLNDNQKKVYAEHFKRFDKISLREKDTSIISGITDKKVEWVLDPTLLLNEKQWDEICSKPVVQGKYIFCYFLGDDEKQRKLTTEYAQKHNLQIVTLPHLLNKFRKCDENFGDIKLYNVSPAELLSLVKNAEYVFTDSFHISVFSYIYNKPFLVFARKGFASMQTRIVSILDIFKAQERFCVNRKQKTIKYIEKIFSAGCSYDVTELEDMKRLSIKYLQDIIEGTDKKKNAD